jgi:hypothetical protein
MGLGRAIRRVYRVFLDSPNVMRHWKRCSAVEKKFDDFVVIPMGGQNERSYVRRESGRVGW